MEYKIVPVAHLNESQVRELAKLHHAVMHSLLSDLGLPFVEKYYQIACHDLSVIGVCVLLQNGMPLGWAIGSPKPDQLNRRMREPFLRFIIQILRVLFTRPSVAWQVLVSARSASTQMKRDSVELTYIGVDKSARKHGLGEAVLDAFIKASASKYRSVVLSVEEDNDTAITLYTKVGFKIIESFAEGKFKRHRMELNIKT